MAFKKIQFASKSGILGIWKSFSIFEFKKISGFSMLIMPEIHNSTLRVKISVCLVHKKSNQDKTPTFQKNLEKVTNLYDKMHILYVKTKKRN